MIFSSEPIQLSDCWAKTDRDTGLPAVTVRDHCLIVGAVAEAVLGLIPASCHHLAPAGTVTLAAAHDIGKITPGFLRKCPLSRFASIHGSQDSCGNHALVSQAFLASLTEMQDQRKVPLAWALAAGGHHGSYPTEKVRNQLERLELSLPWPDPLRRELLTELAQHFGPLPSELVKAGSRVHWLTGYVTFCDWIGSNTDWFPLHPATPLRDCITLASARAGARAALNVIGWHRRRVSRGKTFSQLFAKDEAVEFLPRPLQETLISLADLPGLYIVEAPMGMGKTEAALAVAYRRWTEGDEAGLYFALPTQLTSNRIHDRVFQFLQRVVHEPTFQTLVHGNAWLSEERIHRFEPAATAPGEVDATEASRWFTSSRKPLLAPFGTGTIDQALMACISAKHSALRLFALSGKIVVIDEVHSYDPYTSALVDQLIQWLLEVGSTVIVLSATLSAKRRSEMIEKAGASEPSPAPAAYPLITKVIGKSATHHLVCDPAIKESIVHLRHIPAENSDFIAEIARAAEAGACVLVIRNSVKSAQESFRAIKEALHSEAIPIGLLHSRFPHFQRQENEGQWMAQLGENPARRPVGCVLIATQVVEQSVDIDADLLITDLAPTDLLLQRIGRLHRHPRPRPAGFENAHCWILQPTVDWTHTSKSICESIGASAFIYPPISLYHAQQIWSPRTCITLPTEIRTLLESATTSTENLPAGAVALTEQLEQDTANMVSKALRQGPFQAVDRTDTEGAQTRYNIQPSIHLVLLTEAPRTKGYETIITLIKGISHLISGPYFHHPLAKALHENAARIPRYLVSAALKNQPAWLTAHMTDAVLAVRSDSSTLLEIIGGEKLNYQLHYHPEQGIHYEKIICRATSYTDEDDDSWF